MEEDILRRLEAIPGVSQAAISDTVPLEGEGSNNPVYVEDHLYRATAAPPLRGFHFISPGYISTVGSRLVAGREFSWIDTYDHALVALVSENMARELWKEPKAALGKRIRFGRTDAWRTIIGVVADLRNNGVDQPAPPIVYWPLLMRDFGAKDLAARTVTFVIRTPRAGTAALLADLQRALGGVNSRLPVANVKTVQSVYDRSLARTTFTFTLLLIAGGMALLLGVIGLYGVISYSVAQRTREIGVRLALGASPSGVSRMFIRHGLLLSAVGAMGGLAGAFALTRLMKSLLYDVSPADPFTYAVVAAGLMVISALASYLPARMTTRIAPSIALRSE
jgi:predicted permease